MYNCSKDVAFQVDCSQKENGLILFIILSHPLTIGNLGDILKYYQNPTESNKKDAIKNLKESFQETKLRFAVAWTYIEVESISSTDNILPPNFFITEKPILESIVQMMSDASIGKFKQLQQFYSTNATSQIT